MTRAKTLTMAAQMKVNRKAAASMRCRFLSSELENCLESYKEHGNLISICFAIPLLQEAAYLKKRVNQKFQKKSEIDDTRIAAAQEVDVREVVKFTRGKAVAWCHEDRRPSLYYGDRTNRAVCPVCDKKFNAIDVLMTRDGYSFIEAVKALT